MRSLVVIALLTACASASEQSASTSASARSSYLAVPGGRIYFEEAGKGVPVVLIHGGFGDRRMWDAQFNELARDFRVVRYDHRGFGNSTAPDSVYSPVRDLLQLLDQLGIARAHIIGNSVGGGVALDFAVLYPERVHKVVVVASGANGYPYSADDVAGIVAVFRAAEAQGVDRAAELWLQDPMIAIASKHPRSADLVRRMIQDNRNIFRMEHWPEGKLKPSAYDRLNELRMPVLFVVGENDTPVVQRASGASAARVSGAETFRMPGADHLPQMTHPDVFTQRVTAFLQQPATTRSDP
jgi:pimeloyl-ACP methyl ester carboxylesterase